MPKFSISTFNFYEDQNMESKNEDAKLSVMQLSESFYLRSEISTLFSHIMGWKKSWRNKMNGEFTKSHPRKECRKLLNNN